MGLKIKPLHLFFNIQYYIKQANLIVFGSDHSCHVVDSNGKTISGSASNGDRVVITGQG